MSINNIPLPKFHDGTASLTYKDGSTVAHLSDFWSWAHSDLMGNTERGILAEYIVACAIGVEKEERTEWAPYDLCSKEGIRIEVKSSGYLQTWGQKRLSSPTFGIQPTCSWDALTNEYESEKRRQADLYVFCLHTHTDPETANPLDLSQWEFYIISTHVLNQTVGAQKRISLGSLIKLGAMKCDFKDLYETVKSVAKEQHFLIQD